MLNRQSSGQKRVLTQHSRLQLQSCTPLHRPIQPAILCREAKGGGARGFGETKPSRPPPAPAAAEAMQVEADKRWKVEAAAPEEWEAWLAEQKKEAKITSGNLYLQVNFRYSGCSCGCTLVFEAWAAAVQSFELVPQTAPLSFAAAAFCADCELLDGC